MREREAADANPELKTLVAEAAQALALLDVQRLGVLICTCEALKLQLQRQDANPELRARLAREVQAAAPEMAVFARVLDATRENLAVMSRLRELRLGRLEYQPKPVAWAGTRAGSGDGND
jgi:hypothetical protein